MCGICGTVTIDPSRPVDEGRLVSMRDALSHRGPDDFGQYVAPGVGIASRRLAILDLSERGHMPMSSPDGRFWIVYNGEVYNYKALRSDLEARGLRFRSNTDTEVVLGLYMTEGPEMLHRLNGMFAIAIWDAKDRSLFLARDRLGVKPLYYAWHDESFHFASEEKALFAQGISPAFDPNTWEELLCFRYVAGERSPFTGIHRLLPGHYLIVKDGTARKRRWWHLAERVRELAEDLPADPVAWFGDRFDSAVDLRRISDVPVGVLLSGGLDSSSVASSLAAQSGYGLSSFTVRFAEAQYDEWPLALQVAEKWNLKPHSLMVQPSELLVRLLEASWLNDEPLAHGNDAHLLAISRLAKPLVTVLLSGEGADETLGGYTRYVPLQFPRLLEGGGFLAAQVARMLPAGGRMRKLAHHMSLGSLDRMVLYNSCDVLPADLEGIGMRPSERFPFREEVLSEAKGLYPGDRVRQAMYYDQHTFLCSILDRNDRMTMGASIECRVPFLDFRLVEGVATLPSAALFTSTSRKRVLRDSVGFRLPEAVRRHRKWGFGVPWTRYFREIPIFRDLLINVADAEPILSGPFDRAKIRQLVADFLKGDDSHQGLVRQLVMISIWHQACFGPPQQHRSIVNEVS